MKFLIVLLFLSMCSLGRGEIDCSTLKTMPGFEFDKIVGVWYLMKGTSISILENSKCIKLALTQKGPNELYGILEAKKIKDDSDIYTKVILKWDSNKQNFQGQQIRGSMIENVERKVLDTDYETYMIVSHCNEETQSLDSWVFSKNRDLGADYFDKIDKVFEKNQIHEFEYFQIDQSNC